MHVHTSHINPNAASLYSAAAAAKAAATQRAADVRKKLMTSASKIAGKAEANGKGIFAIAQGTEQGSPQHHGRKNPRAPEKKQAADEDQSGKPLSMWA
jgi:hypothetical protein